MKKSIFIITMLVFASCRQLPKECQPENIKSVQENVYNIYDSLHFAFINHANILDSINVKITVENGYFDSVNNELFRYEREKMKLESNHEMAEFDLKMLLNKCKKLKE